MLLTNSSSRRSPATLTSSTSTAAANKPQIIILPPGAVYQHTPSSIHGKSILKISPKLTTSNNNTTIYSTTQSVKPELVAHSPIKILGQVMKNKSVVNPLKRPLSPASSTISEEDSGHSSCGEDSKDNTKNVDGVPVRKRANLDHLSPEEKLLRRKLKNRVAAQNARDKKRAKMDEMEDLISLLKEQKKALEKENERLKKINSRLEEENGVLRIKDQAPLSPAYSTASSSSSNGSSYPVGNDLIQDIVVSRPVKFNSSSTKEPAELLINLLLKGSLLMKAKRKVSGRGMAVDLSTTLAICLLWMCSFLIKTTSPHFRPRRRIHQSSYQNHKKTSSSWMIKKLPLKKRTLKLKRSWNPASQIWKIS